MRAACGIALHSPATISIGGGGGGGGGAAAADHAVDVGQTVHAARAMDWSLFTARSCRNSPPNVTAARCGAAASCRRA
jgi:hypothetical protein